VVSLKEEIPEIKWNIEPEFKNFNTYTGQKATGNFRGRSYTVWFATEIPLPYGPWKLQGLPGIILEAIDDKNEIYFSVKKISLGKSMIPKMPQVEESFTLKEYISVEQPKRLEEIMQLMRSRMKDRNTIITDIDTGRESALEITYEWEKTDK
jgi:GLPGLI family protein